MNKYLNDILINAGVNGFISIYLVDLILLGTIFLIAFLVDFIEKKFFLRFIEKLVGKTKNRWDDIFLERRGFHAIAQIPPAVIAYLLVPLLTINHLIIHRLISTYIVIMVVIIIFRFIKSLEKLYEEHEVAKKKPIRVYVQVLEIMTLIIGVVIGISSLLNKSPAILLSGIGAATAIILLVFKDLILGFVAGIQINTNNMIKLGDWIEMPSHNADGDVIEINLTTVKVRNFDKTITNIPIYAIVSNSFRNWMGMHEFGGRRIKRPIYIDMTSIKICTPHMIEKYKKIEYLSGYMTEKEEEVRVHNEKYEDEEEEKVNRRNLTNIGTFRSYVISYLKEHPGIDSSKLLLVRQLDPTENGLPLEVYAFTNTTAWTEYEPIQADIFDHLLAVIPEFDLRVFQSPSGLDIKDGFRSKV